MIYNDMWIQVDLKTNEHIKGVITQGRAKNYEQWVTSYQVMYKINGQNNFETIKSENGQPKVSFLIQT